MPQIKQVIVEIVDGVIISVWADRNIVFEIGANQHSYTIHGEAEVRIWFSSNPEMPQYDPASEGLTKYYPV